MTHEHMLGPDAPSWEVIARYLTGEGSVADVNAVRTWMARDRAGAEIVAGLERAVASMRAEPLAERDVEVALGRARSRRDSLTVRDISLARSITSRAWRIALPLAAGLVLLLGGAALFRAINHRGTGLAAHAYHAPVGRTDSVTLSDGTHILLAPGSDLNVAAGYGGSDRTVELRGEALFDVRHDARRPFVVHAGSATIADLGTTFAVRSDAGTPVQVVVKSGIVALRASGTAPAQAVILNGGDRGTLHADGAAVAERGVSLENDLAWTSGKLLFEDAPLARVRADLRRWYGVELEDPDSALVGRHLTASFDGEPASKVLDVIALALGVTIEPRGGDTAVVHAASRQLPRQ